MPPSVTDIKGSHVKRLITLINDPLIIRTGGNKNLALYNFGGKNDFDCFIATDVHSDDVLRF